MCVCTCVCVCTCARACVCLCVHVCELDEQSCCVLCKWNVVLLGSVLLLNNAVECLCLPVSLESHFLNILLNLEVDSQRFTDSKN